MPDDDKDFILEPRIDLYSLSRYLNYYIDKSDEIKTPGWLLNSWSPRLLADMLKKNLRRSSDEALANIEKHLHGEDYAPIKDSGDVIQSELTSLDRAVMFWKWGNALMKALEEERRSKLSKSVEIYLTAAYGRKIPPERLEFNRDQSAELINIIERAEHHGQFWRLLLCIDKHIQGQYEPLAELVGWADFSGPDLANDEKNGLKSGPIPTKALGKIYKWLKAAAARLTEPLPNLPLGPLPQPLPEKEYIYLRLMPKGHFKSCERICLALPHVSGFYEVCNKIVDHNGTRRGYTHHLTGKPVSAMSIPQYSGGSRFGAVLAENNYSLSIEAIVDEYGPQTLYIIALPEYYCPRYHVGDDNFIGRLLHRLPQNYNIIFISGLEGEKVTLDANDRPTSPLPDEGEKKLSKAQVLLSPKLKSPIVYNVGYGKTTVIPNTPLGAIGISTYGSLSSFGISPPKDSLSSLRKFKCGLTCVLDNIGRDLSFLFVCYMNDNENQYKKMCELLEKQICPRLGDTRLVMTDHDFCYAAHPSGHEFKNYSRMYNKGGLLDSDDRINYSLDGCGLYSQIFMLNPT